MDTPELIRSSLETMKAAVNYNEWIFSNFKPYIGSKIIELGAGIGNFIDFLHDRDLVVAVDYDKQSIKHLHDTYSHRQNIEILDMDITSSDILKLKKYCPDTVILLNVLEHIEDDDLALSNIFEILDRKGKVLIQVPAMEVLYGSFDIIAGHYRRYNKKSLKEKLRRAGFDITSIYYMNAISTFGWFLNYRILKRKKIPSSQVLFLDRYLIPLQRKIESISRPPFGLSLIAIAEKNEVSA